MPSNPRPQWDPVEPESADTAPRVLLTDNERVRLSQAASDLDEARCEDLAALDTAGLIRMVERLRGSLDDVVHLLRDVQN
jgi:hypothetical protein